MRITTRRIACLIAVAAAPLAACNVSNSTTPYIEPATGIARSAVDVHTPAETLRSCPEMRIPELLCRGELPDTVPAP